MEQNNSINRRQYIIDMLNDGKTIDSKELSKHFNVSMMTIRRDLHILQEMGLIDLFYGGAVLKKDRFMITKVSKRDTSKDSGKLAIAKVAASYLKNDETIFLDAGSTVLQMIRYIPDIHLKVITNSMPIIEQLSLNPKVELIVAPGKYISEVEGMIDISTLEFLTKYHVDKAFIGAYAIDLNFGVSTNDELEARIKAIMNKNSTTSFLLADHSKFYKIGPYSQNKLNEFDYIITDNLIKQDQVLKIKQINSNLIITN